MWQEECEYDEITCLRIGVAHFSCNRKASEFVRHGTGLSSAYCKIEGPMKRKEKQRRQRVHQPKPMHKTMMQRHKWKGNKNMITLHKQCSLCSPYTSDWRCVWVYDKCQCPTVWNMCLHSFTSISSNYYKC